jgi:hypothetical protein
MNKFKIILTLFVGLLLFGCSEEVMDEINENQSSTNPTSMSADNLVPDAILKTAYETTATDLAWYTSVFIEHNAGTWNQLYDADGRVGLESASLMNNSWNAIYDVMNLLNTIIEKTDPESGEESLNYSARGVAQILMAYNLAVATDMWGDVPYSEAFQGAENLNPVYDSQENLYTEIFSLLDNAVANLEQVSGIDATDFIYGGDPESWIKAAHALKARYALQLSKVNGEATAAQAALDAIAAGGFDSADDDMLFEYGAYPQNNPWGTFYYGRDQHSVSSTFFNLLDERNDPRIPYLISTVDGNYEPAPIGEAAQTFSGYSKSLIATSGARWNLQVPTPIITYHEQKFIEAEAKFYLGDATWETALEEAIDESFKYTGVHVYGEALPDTMATADDHYFEQEVQPRLTAGNELEEIMTQKYIAMFEQRSIQAYNDYRRTGYPEMQNPNNETVGFPHRMPYALSETQSNPDNVPDVDIYSDKIWWAAGSK